MAGQQKVSPLNQRGIGSASRPGILRWSFSRQPDSIWCDFSSQGKASEGGDGNIIRRWYLTRHRDSAETRRQALSPPVRENRKCTRNDDADICCGRGACRDLICLSCPEGCRLTIDVGGGQLLELQGNGCEMGMDFVRSLLADSMCDVAAREPSANRGKETLREIAASWGISVKAVRSRLIPAGSPERTLFRTVIEDVRGRPLRSGGDPGLRPLHENAHQQIVGVSVRKGAFRDHAVPGRYRRKLHPCR